MADTRFDEVFAYRRQYEFGSPEYEAVTGLIDLCTENDIFSEASAFRFCKQLDEQEQQP